MENGRLYGALRKAHTKKKRKEESTKQLRRENGAGAIFFGPFDVQRHNELNQRKEPKSEKKLYSRQE
ncbi:hypothetical protein K3495_g1364 [Podosphaera aphanis]|nr:hypothetical protein K3495_g1364 [Podosphaera aphanis]